MTQALLRQSCIQQLIRLSPPRRHAFLVLFALLLFLGCGELALNTPKRTQAGLVEDLANAARGLGANYAAYLDLLAKERDFIAELAQAERALTQVFSPPLSVEETINAYLLTANCKLIDLNSRLETLPSGDIDKSWRLTAEGSYPALLRLLSLLALRERPLMLNALHISKAQQTLQLEVSIHYYSSHASGRLS